MILTTWHVYSDASNLATPSLNIKQAVKRRFAPNRCAIDDFYLTLSVYSKQIAFSVFSLHIPTKNIQKSNNPAPDKVEKTVVAAAKRASSITRYFLLVFFPSSIGIFRC